MSDSIDPTVVNRLTNTEFLSFALRSLMDDAIIGLDLVHSRDICPTVLIHCIFGFLGFIRV